MIPNRISALPGDIYDWLQRCAVVLTGASAVAIDAMVMEEPVVTMDFVAELLGVDFIETGATLHVTTEGQLEDAVRTAVSCPERLTEVKSSATSFFRREFFGLDGRTAERCAEAVGRFW